MTKTIKEKISEAKELGVKFRLIDLSHGSYGASVFEIFINKNTTSEEFENILDQKIDELRSKEFLVYLNDNKLLC